MKIVIYQSFSKDISKIKDKKLIKRIKTKTLQLQQKSLQNLLLFGDIEKLSGEGSYCKVRIGNYRIGCALQGKTLHLYRILHRRDIYKKFP